ncbi:hypothetical protein TNCV_4690061 [Trichonephila clavipes]|nr:hypothetical protein TNCV_4690061 [Trichonephila clavipes]
MATGSSLTQNYSRSQNEVLRDLHKVSEASVCFSDESTFEILQNKTQFVRRRRGEKSHSDGETPYKNNDFVSHQRQGYWTSIRG